jgi:type IV secretory pathway TrbL component
VAVSWIIVCAVFDAAVLLLVLLGLAAPPLACVCVFGPTAVGAAWAATIYYERRK